MSRDLLTSEALAGHTPGQTQTVAPPDGLLFAPYLWEQIRLATAGLYDAFPSGHTAVTLLVLW